MHVSLEALAVISSGVDKFGAFAVREGRCGVCGKHELCIQYHHRPRIPEYSRTSPSLLVRVRREVGRGVRQLGLTCGCYGKLHRQVGHIEG